MIKIFESILCIFDFMKHLEQDILYHLLIEQLLNNHLTGLETGLSIQTIKIHPFGQSPNKGRAGREADRDNRGNRDNRRRNNLGSDGNWDRWSYNSVRLNSNKYRINEKAEEEQRRYNI